MPSRQVLIADPDPDTARLLAPPLRQRGHAVATVRNGSRALELCILRAPDLVIFDVACPLLDSQTFRQILRANPRTERVPVLITGRTEDGAPQSLRDGFLRKPFNVDEVLARIDQIFRRADAAQRAHRSEQGMDGTLGQLSLVDLLQVLGQSRKSGDLRIVGPRGSALVRLVDGEIASAQAENMRGLKAFFRLLSWRDGSFSFAPGRKGASTGSEPTDIYKPVEELLLEGLRQSDELGAVREQLPPPSARLLLRANLDELLVDQQPVAAEILELARDGATVGEIIERSRATDHLAAQTLLDLLARELLAPAPGDLSARPAPRPLLAPGAAHALRVSLLHGRSDGSRPRGKILLAAAGPALLAAFLERLATVPGCSIALDEVHVVGSPFGTVGRLDVTEDLAVDLVQLPADESSRPLWLPFSARAIGALAIVSGGNAPPPHALLSFLAHDQSLPVVLVGPTSVPPELDDLGPEVSATAEGPQGALRLLLERAAQRTHTAFS